jgi:hypothetical protein
MAVEVLISNEYVLVTVDRAEGVVRYERTEAVWPTIALLQRVHEDTLAAILGLPRGAYSILLDLRRAPPRNDAEFEAAIERYVSGVTGHFTRYAVLVKTAVGALQVKRVERRTRRRDARVFHDEQAALDSIRPRR